ncbi:MAG: CPBP family intramembrane glutamic endopeptidase [Planctomycetota bacterium]
MTSDQIPAFVAIGVLAAASLVLWAVVTPRLLRDALLPYEPRWRVPWGAAAGLSVLFFVALSIAAAAAVTSVTADTPVETATPQQFLERSGQAVLIHFVFIGIMAAMIHATVGGGLRDFGLPTSGTRLAGDIRLGLGVFLAAYAPCTVLNLGLSTLTGNEEIHPTLEQLLATPDWRTLLGAWLMAGLVAPFFEEFLHRLLLQGWLEKLEDHALGWRITRRPRCVGVENADADEDEESNEPSDDDAPMPTRGELVSFGGLGHGWAPIFISSLVFAFAHTNQGPVQLPLFLLAIMLGWVYHRTHRIVPCVVAHMAFNTASLLLFVLSEWVGR